MTPSVHSAMDDYYHHDQLKAIWEEIGKLHICYLEMDDSPQKLEQRHKLEDTIGHFLSLAPHNRKFLFCETANVLYHSASTKKDFSGYKAASGWNAIALYAANLWNQPWRKEYKQIKLYSGYYKHQISANLTGAEVMFELMGYKNDGEVLILDGPICPDRVVSISQDALVAYVECQLLKAIWEEVSINFKINWLEVLEFRQSHLCSPKHSVQALNYRCHERQFQQHTRSHSQGTDIRNCSASATLPANHSFPPLYSQATLPLHSMYNNGYAPSNYSIYTPQNLHHHYPYDQNYTSITYTPVSKPMYNTNYHCPNGYSVPIPSISQLCPTGQLIEVESQLCDELSSKSPVSTTGETWDYVYKDLESQGYSKDLGERGDVLSMSLDRKTKAPTKEAKKVKTHAVDKMLGYLSLNDKKHPTQGSSTLSENGYSNNEHDRIDAVNSKTNNTRNINKTSSIPAISKLTQKWECGSCTYLNDQKRDICEICSKSKNIVSDEMEIGGSQCSTCTLVNPKDNINCSACLNSLKGSPTYI